MVDTLPEVLYTRVHMVGAGFCPFTRWIAKRVTPGSGMQNQDCFDLLLCHNVLQVSIHGVRMHSTSRRNVPEPQLYNRMLHKKLFDRSQLYLGYCKMMKSGKYCTGIKKSVTYKHGFQATCFMVIFWGSQDGPLLASQSLKHSVSSFQSSWKKYQGCVQLSSCSFS